MKIKTPLSTPSAKLLRALDRANLRYTEPLAVYRFFALGSRVRLWGSSGDGDNAAYEWFVWRNGELKTSDMGDTAAAPKPRSAGDSSDPLLQVFWRNSSDRPKRKTRAEPPSAHRRKRLTNRITRSCAMTTHLARTGLHVAMEFSPAHRVRRKHNPPLPERQLSTRWAARPACWSRPPPTSWISTRSARTHASWPISTTRPTSAPSATRLSNCCPGPWPT